MSQSLPYAAAVAGIPGSDVPQSLVSLAQLISDSAKDVRGNRATALELSRRIQEIVSIIEDEVLDDPSSRHAVRGLEDLLRETLDTLQASAKRTIISQLLHAEKDKEKINGLKERVEMRLEALKLQFRVSTDAVLATAQETSCRTQILIRLDALAPSARKQFNRPATADSQAARIPPKPPLFFGRAAETQAVVDSVLAGTPGHVAILGGPGMGKTTLALSVLYQQSLTAYFGTRRYFIDCSAAEGLSGSLSIVATQLGIRGTDPQAIQRALRFVLGGAPSVLVLDNFESAWEAPGNRVDAEATLQFMAGISLVRLIITMRGAERPLSVHWSRPFLAPLAPLSAEAAAQVFLSVADASGSDAESMSELLAHVENVPLAVVLIANESPAALLSRWQEEKTRMLASGSGRTRLTSLDVSISMSIRYVRMAQVPAALRLLRQLAMLPTGAANIDIAAWDGYDSRALATLLRVSLAMNMQGRRVYVLAPIRTFVHEQMPATDDEISAIKDHYFRLAATVYRGDGQSSLPEDVSILVHEIANIETLVEHSLTTMTLLLPALQSTACLCRFHSDTGISSGQWLLPKALDLAQLYGHQELEADLRLLAAAIDNNMRVAGPTKERAARILALYEAANAQAKYIDAALMATEFSKPEEMLETLPMLIARAEELHDVRRAIKCQGHLGSVYDRNNMPRDAITAYGTSLRMHRRSNLPRGRLYALLTARLGECHLTVGNVTQSRACLEDALTVSRTFSYGAVIAFCSRILGQIFLSSGFVCDAIERLAESNALLELWGSADVLLGQSLLRQAYLLCGDIDAAIVACETIARLQRDLGWAPGVSYTLLSYSGVALHVGDASHSRAILAELRSDWNHGRDRVSLTTRAAFTSQLGQLARLEGDNYNARIYFIVSVITYLRTGSAIGVVITLLQLAEVAEDAMSQGLLATVMLPLIRFGFHRYLAQALLQSARLARRGGDNGTARNRALSAGHHYEIIDNTAGRAEAGRRCHPFLLKQTHRYCMIGILIDLVGAV